MVSTWTAIFTLNADGSCAVSHHAPADPDVIEEIARLAGPVIVEQLFSAEDRERFADIPHGVTVILTDTTGGP